MTVDGLSRTLDAFAQRLRDLGAPVVDHLRPGLSEQEIDEISAVCGGRLTPEARAWWAWHDGDRERYNDDWGRPSLVPWLVFCGLRGALEQSAGFRDIMTAVGHQEEGYVPDPRGEDALFYRQYVTLLQDQRPLVMDCRHPDAPDAPVGFYTTDGGIWSFRTFTEQIGWWNWALDNRFWILGPDGDWGEDPERSPGLLIGRHVNDHV